MNAPSAPRWTRDLRAGARLAGAGVLGVVDVVEAMHGRIARLAPAAGTTPDQPPRGITGFVYRRVRGTSMAVSALLDGALALLEATVPAGPRSDAAGARRDAVVSALNGVMGDALERTGNALAIPTELVTRLDIAPAPDLVVLVHGLCMNHLQWTRDGYDHGLALHAALGSTPVYARYNSGRAVAVNGAELAAALESFTARWPVPVRSITIVGHSMGGLVARAAVHHAQAAGMAWAQQLRAMVFLGTPHHGAVLERGGNWLHRVVGAAPYAAPLARLSGLRSAGITDLRFGNVLASDAAGERFALRDGRTPLPLPAHVPCFAVAGTLGAASAGDGLVTVDSALGRHRRRAMHLRIPPSHRHVARGVGHLQLLADRHVATQLVRWLAQPAA
jgi:hypothetical protein